MKPLKEQCLKEERDEADFRNQEMNYIPMTIFIG